MFALLFSRLNVKVVRGFSLLEVLFASFLLLTAISLTVFLINTSFRSEADSGVKIQALHDAENVLAEIRAFSQQDFRTGMSTIDGKVWPSTNPAYIIESSARWQKLALPCTELEEQYQVGRELPDLARKELTESVWKVVVQVKKSQSGQSVLELTTLIADLKPEAFTLRMLAPGGTTAPARGELDFRAVAYDSQNRVLSDLILTWYVEPLNSFGSIHRMRRDGWECVYKNVYQDYGNRYTSTPGFCRIVVRGEYKGSVQYAQMEITNQ